MIKLLLDLRSQSLARANAAWEDSHPAEDVGQRHRGTVDSCLTAVSEKALRLGPPAHAVNMRGQRCPPYRNIFVLRVDEAPAEVRRKTLPELQHHFENLTYLELFRSLLFLREVCRLTSLRRQSTAVAVVLVRA